MATKDTVAPTTATLQSLHQQRLFLAEEVIAAMISLADLFEPIGIDATARAFIFQTAFDLSQSHLLKEGNEGLLAPLAREIWLQALWYSVTSPTSDLNNAAKDEKNGDDTPINLCPSIDSSIHASPQQLSTNVLKSKQSIFQREFMSTVESQNIHALFAINPSQDHIMYREVIIRLIHKEVYEKANEDTGTHMDDCSNFGNGKGAHCIPAKYVVMKRPSAWSALDPVLLEALWRCGQVETVCSWVDHALLTFKQRSSCNATAPASLSVWINVLRLAMQAYSVSGHNTKAALFYEKCRDYAQKLGLKELNHYCEVCFSANGLHDNSTVDDNMTENAHESRLQHKEEQTQPMVRILQHSNDAYLMRLCLENFKICDFVCHAAKVDLEVLSSSAVAFDINKTIHLRSLCCGSYERMKGVSFHHIDSQEVLNRLSLLIVTLDRMIVYTANSQDMTFDCHIPFSDSKQSNPCHNHDMNAILATTTLTTKIWFLKHLGYMWLFVLDSKIHKSTFDSIDSPNAMEERGIYDSKIHQDHDRSLITHASTHPVKTKHRLQSKSAASNQPVPPVLPLALLDRFDRGPSTVAELRKALKSHGLLQTGNKAELLLRWQQHQARTSLTIDPKGSDCTFEKIPTLSQTVIPKQLLSLPPTPALPFFIRHAPKINAVNQLITATLQHCYLQLSLRQQYGIDKLSGAATTPPTYFSSLFSFICLFLADTFDRNRGYNQVADVVLDLPDTDDLLGILSYEAVTHFGIDFHSSGTKHSSEIFENEVEVTFPFPSVPNDWSELGGQCKPQYPTLDQVAAPFLTLKATNLRFVKQLAEKISYFYANHLSTIPDHSCAVIICALPPFLNDKPLSGIDRNALLLCRLECKIGPFSTILRCGAR